MADSISPRGEHSLIRCHEKLAIYRNAHELAVRIHALTLRLPALEQYEEAGQIRRSSKSVCSQIVEGHALRSYKADYLRYLARAYGSAEETIEHAMLLLETGSADRDRAEWLDVLARYQDLTRSTFKYMQSVRRGHDPAYGPETSS